MKANRQGHTFILYFPVVIRQIKSVNKQKLINEKGYGHILLIEDEAELLAVYQEFLLEQGYSVDAYNNGADALVKFAADPGHFDLILTDHIMPDMTGKQLIPKLLEIRTDIPIILATGYADQLSDAEVKTLNICQYLLKPLKLTQLQQIIEQCLHG